jgi:hypothetical protein
MEEWYRRSYLKEEEFLDEFGDVANVASKVINGEWQPNYDANDSVRKNHEYFLSTGELTTLVFNGASIYHNASGFSSVRIILKSSKRIVNVRVSEINGKLVGKKIIDKPNIKTKKNYRS